MKACIGSITEMLLNLCVSFSDVYEVNMFKLPLLQPWCYPVYCNYNCSIFQTLLTNVVSVSLTKLAFKLFCNRPTVHTKQ